MDRLGDKMLIVAFSIKGPVSKGKCYKLIHKIMKRIALNPVHSPMIYNYPVCDKGGKGFTYIQPITESFIAVDAWPDFKGAYLMVCSCKLFWVKNVLMVIKSLGYKVLETKINELSLLVDQLTTG